jgi:competence protein ComEC
VFLFFSQKLHRSPTLDIVFLDVGQGDAVLVVSPEGKTMLIDSGPPPYREGATSETVAAVLAEWHLATIDFLVHSHPHADHIGGSADVLEQIPVDRIIENGIAPKSESFETYDSLAVVKGITREMAVPGSLIHLSTTTTVEILAPDQTLLDSSNLNDSSVVLRIVFGETCALLTGDIEFAAEVRLVSRYRSDLHCAVVKIPHHGSNTSSTPGFVGRTVSSTSSTQATFAVVSVARVNRFGLPDQEALNRWSNSGAIVRSTQNGAVWLKSDGKTFREYDWRKGW